MFERYLKASLERNCRKIDKFTDKYNASLYSIDGVTGFKGEIDKILLLYALITNTLLEDVNEKVLKKVFDLGFKIDKNVGMETLEKIGKILDKYEEEK